MTNEPTVPDEREVRRLRDRVYGSVCQDNNWDACRDYWMQLKNVEWLRNRQPKQSERPN